MFKSEQVINANLYSYYYYNLYTDDNWLIVKL